MEYGSRRSDTGGYSHTGMCVGAVKGKEQMTIGLVPSWLQEFEKEAGYMKPEENTYYNPREFALSLGFTDVEAEALGKAGADATNIRRVARAKGLMPDQGERDADIAAGEAEVKAALEAMERAKVAEALNTQKCWCGVIHKPDSKIGIAHKAEEAARLAAQEPPPAE